MWQPIETAPKDGTRVLVWGAYSSLYALAECGDGGPFYIRAVAVFEGGRWRMTTPDDGSFIFDVYEAEWDGRQHAYITPEMWAPLPDEPPENPA